MIDRIYCRNFRRVEEADIAVRDGITVIIGPNGSGKSSIMEAILFNLFGKVKTGTKKDSVRRKTASEEDITLTIVDFTLKDDHYRCHRWYTAKGSVMAELRVYNDEEYAKLQEKPPSIPSDKTLGEEIAASASGVTEQISGLLNISYDGFKASFMSQQKELNSMAALTQEKRKEFFLDLLGYKSLDKIKPAIASDLRLAQSQKDIIDKQNLSVPQIEREIKRYSDDIADKDRRIGVGRTKVAEKKDEFAKASADYEESRVASEKAAAFQQDVNRLFAEKQQLQDEIARLKVSIEENKKKSAGYDENSSIATRLADVQEKVSKAREYDKMRSDKETLEGALNEKQSQIDTYNKKISELAKKTEKEPDLDTLQKGLAELREKKAALKQQRTSASVSKDGMQKLLSSVDAGETAKCPTCGSEISSADGRSHLEGEIEQLSRELAENAKADAANDNEISKANEGLEIAKMALRTYQSDLRTKEKLEGEMAQMSKGLSDSKNRIEELSRQLEEKKGNALSRIDIKHLDDQIVELKGQLARENEMKNAFYAVQRDVSALEKDEKRLVEVDKSLDEKQEYLKTSRKVVSKLDVNKAKKDKAEHDLDRFQNLLSEYQTQRASAQGLLNAAQGNLKTAKKQAEELVELDDKIENHIAAQQVIEYLRKNLPARIAPRLAHEASQVLDIATNGRYSMLDIDDSYEVYVYADDDIRPLAMMSGGEADVIALSVRIAIAKLILEATGITEQTFILDEIFGALDDERRESTCLALQNISQQLCKILCITHIDEIKDMADWTFAVEMDENGVSHVREIIDSEAAGEMLSGASEDTANTTD